MSKARETLQAAAAEVAKSKQSIQALETAAGRAEQAATDAKAELAKYKDLETELTKWRVDQVKRGLSTKTLPEKLKGSVEAKRAATEELEQAESTLDVIGEELNEARSQMQPAQDQMQQAAITLLMEHGKASTTWRSMRVN